MNLSFMRGPAFVDLPVDLDTWKVEEKIKRFQEERSKLDIAIRHIARLDEQISHLRRLFRRAEKNKSYAVRYNLRMQLSIVSGVKVMYHHYAALREELVGRLQQNLGSLAPPPEPRTPPYVFDESEYE